MSHLQYFSYEGFGDRVRTETHYSQAVRIGDKIEISGQGGWDPITEKIPEDLAQQVDQAFANVELALKKAGGKGWSQVYRVRAYFAPFAPEAVERTVENLKRYCPDHRPLLTAVEVKGLFAGMGFEIEVEAHVA
ncbi:related to L-PSP endoribonuclease family protein [Cephalotrichum gorgonifer]|uniref:Related to L-PSP endoribonuclease family protein n=1 Tax=Cephalotrichum gorgonifer TaxID=2041049 RepID=A0AAE8N8H1_9PEZI|nr:related to L-PSP endoribonuclease family protein [Cephalotrichum gorgonifer]